MTKGHLAGKIYVIGEDGEREFGWGPERITDFDSKANWAALVAEYAEKKDWVQLLVDVIKDYTKADGVQIIISKNIKFDGKGHGYIDHQSLEGDNREIFDSGETLEAFLFGYNSFIMLDNDNH